MDNSIITVESGDTLYALAAKHGTTVDALVESNSISDPNLIFVGQHLFLPTASPPQTTTSSESTLGAVQLEESIIVTSGDTLSKIAQDYGTTVKSLAQANAISDPNLILIGQELVIPIETDSGYSGNQAYPGDFPHPGDTTPTATDSPVEPRDDLPTVPSFSPEWLEANIESVEPEPSSEAALTDPSISSESAEPNFASEILETTPPDQPFNDITSDQSDIHGFDFSSNSEADALFGYVGEDAEGAWAAGTGLVDWENSDPDGWFAGFEILTAEGKGNILGTFEQDDFWGTNFDAQVIETDFDISGHGLNVGYLNASGNYGGNPDGFGLMFNANIADIQYSNGVPSATNSNDIGVDFGLSAGAGGGFNFVYSDPDGDEISNLGFDVSAGPVDFGITSEYLGQKAESGLESAGNYVVEKAYEIDNAFDKVGRLFTGGGLFG